MLLFRFQIPARLRRRSTFFSSAASFFVVLLWCDAFAARAQSPVSSPASPGVSTSFAAQNPSLLGASLPTPNGFNFFFDAVEKLVRADPLSSGSKPLPAPEQVLVKRGNVSRNKDALAALRLALKNPILHPPVRDAASDFGAYSGFRALAEVLDQESAVRISNRDYAGAMQSKLDCIEFGVVISRGAPIRAYLADFAIETIGRSGLESIVPHLSRDECALAATRLERIESLRPPFADAIREGKIAALAVTRDALGTGNWDETMAQARKLDGTPLSETEIETLGTIGETDILAGIERAFNAALTGANAPYRAAPQRAVALDPWSLAFVGDVNSPSFRTEFEAARAANRLLALALRLRIERISRGVYPDKFPTAPDPFVGAAGSDAPLIYRRNGDSFSLYSVGPNAKDDGGIAAPLGEDGTLLPAASGDILAPNFPL